MPSRALKQRIALLALVGLAAGGCRDSAVAPTSQPEALRTSATYGATLLQCPVGVTRSASATIGLLGGVLELDGHRLVIPAQALLLPTEFTLTVPASNYVEIDVRAAGQEHFDFLEPVALTISYERCTRSNIDQETLRVYHVHDDSKVILEDLGGSDDKVVRAVTATTDHLSDYALGSPH